jgi:hypothetical protein
MRDLIIPPEIRDDIARQLEVRSGPQPAGDAAKVRRSRRR